MFSDKQSERPEYLIVSIGMHFKCMAICINRFEDVSKWPFKVSVSFYNQGGSSAAFRKEQTAFAKRVLFPSLNNNFQTRTSSSMKLVPQIYNKCYKAILVVVNLVHIRGLKGLINSLV
jgi:hypothetical protein